MAKAIKVDRTGYYRSSTTQAARDQVACTELLTAHTAHPFYGVRRLSLALGWSQNKTRRIRQLAGVSAQTYRTTKTRQAASSPQLAPPSNALTSYVRFIRPDRPQDGQTYNDMAKESNAWAQDFTHVRCGRQWYYLAVILELKSRRVVGWSVGAAHDTSLTLSALRLALQKNTAPPILHSDQGSEYLSYAHKDLCDAYGMTPWAQTVVATGNYYSQS